jgi:CheY-like chemotaxis protein
LIVDDEYFNIISLQFILKKFHTLIEHAFNGKEALEKLEKKVPCLKCGNDGYVVYFLDINMPIMDGFETVVRLKEMMRAGMVDRGLCIANTGYVDLQTKMECYEKGMDFYITKPIDRAELYGFLK